MAGTRLYVQGAVLAQLVALVLLAVLLGLSQDVPLGGWIFKLRFLHRDSSSLAENTPNTSLSVPVIRVAVLSQEQRDEWTSEKTYLGQVDVQVLDQDTVALLEQSICRTETAQQPSKIMNSELESYDLVMCSGERVWQQLGDGQWVPAPLASLREALPPFIQQQQRRRRRRLQVTLVMESSTSTHLDWRWWAQAVDDSLLQASHNSNMWPSYCLDNDPALLETKVVWDDLLAQRASKTPNDDAKPRTISSRQAVSWLDRKFPTTPPGTVHVVVYVVGSDSVLVDNAKQTSTALTTDSHLFLLVNGSSTDDDPVVFPPLVPLVEHGLCWQNPTFSKNVSTMIFRWQVKRWLQDLLTNLDAESHHQATLATQALRQAPWNVAITNEMVRRYQEAVHVRNEARAAAATGNFLAAVQYLEDSLEASEQVLKDPQLLAPLDMLPPDQYMAVVAPLLFPLLIPFAVGLIREVKRYRTLKLKQV